MLPASFLSILKRIRRRFLRLFIFTRKFIYARSQKNIFFNVNVIWICITTRSSMMPTNLRDAFGGQSRSPNITQFHMLGIVS